MSIKTSQNTPGWLLFLIISIGLHAALAGLSFSPKALRIITPELYKKKAVQRQNPFYIDIITLPPDAIGRKEPPKLIKRFADRSMSVDEERSPLPLYGSGPQVSATPRPITPATAARGAQKTGASGKAAGPVAAEKTIKQSRGSKDVSKESGSPRKKAEKDRDVIIVDYKSAVETNAGEGVNKKTTIAGDAAGNNGRTGSVAPASLFPSKETIAKVVRKGSGARHTGVYSNRPSKKLQINTTELKDARYLLDLKRKLDLYWQYPVAAARRGEQGKLRAVFEIKRDGTIHNIKLVKSSGYPTLDDAVVTALRLCSPLNPLPETFKKDALDVKASFEYILTQLQ